MRISESRPATNMGYISIQDSFGPTYSKIFTLGNCFFKVVKVYKLSELWTS
jgi:hypothetical protein